MELLTINTTITLDNAELLENAICHRIDELIGMAKRTKNPSKQSRYLCLAQRTYNTALCVGLFTEDGVERCKVGTVLVKAMDTLMERLDTRLRKIDKELKSLEK